MTPDEISAFGNRLPYRPRIAELGYGINYARGVGYEDLYGPIHREPPVHPRWRWALLGAVVVACAVVFVAVVWLKMGVL